MTSEAIATNNTNNVHIAWDRVRSLKPLVMQHCLDGDLLKHMPEKIAQAFIELDLYRLMVPEDLGGLELDPLTFFDLCVELASYDGSTGWNFGVCCGSVSMIGTLPLDKLKYVFSIPDCGIAGSIFPPGKATATDGGYIFTGRWMWCSGVHHARWINGTAILYDDDQMHLEGGQPVVLKAQFPREQVTIHDAWHTGGMKGTGSTEYSLEEGFVPEESLFDLDKRPSHPAPVFRLPMTFFGMPLVGVAVGIARGTTEAFKELLLQDKGDLKDRGYAQHALAKAETLYEAAQLHVKEAFRPVWEAAIADRTATLEERAKARRAFVLAGELAIEAVDLCYAAAGGAAVFDHNPFHRNLSDVHVACQHQLLQRRILEQCGQIALGMSVDNPVF